MTKEDKNTQTDIKALAARKQQPKEDTDDEGVYKFEKRGPVEYNIAELTDFIDMVFHGLDPEDDGNVLVWNPKKNIPAYPSTEDRLLKKLGRTKEAYCLYYGTSSCVADPETNTLYNRKSLFKQLHVVVLDDIGTKIPLDKIPEAFTPTYIIESSEGNFQYGYVLDKPISEYAHAEALIQLIYESGISDAGGKMPTKLVRLPSGINGKKGDKGNFLVRLVSTNGKFWSPKDMLSVLDLGVTWDEVLEDTDKVMKTRASKTVGTSPWSNVMAQASSLDGIVDPVLEYFYEKEMVYQETEVWAQIKCPWGDTHTTGDDSAGYSPIGRGGDYGDVRGFKCFHEHCKDRNIHDVLQYVAVHGGIEVGVKEQAAELVANWAYDAVNDCAWQIKGVAQPRPIAMTAFKNTFPRKSMVTTYEGKQKVVADTSLWLSSPSRVTVYGQTYDPTNPAKITQQDEDLRINMFYQPDWGGGAYDEDDIKQFEDFMTYLVPHKDERKYFLDWLAAKAQNMGFRGNAILMIAKMQGTGRTTLADMIGTLLGHRNTENVSFNTITGEGQWNEWLEKPMIITNETKDLSPNSGGFFKAYERLKDMVDPRPKEERINPKFGKQRISMVYSSFLMFSQHENAIAAASGDRRIYVINNAPIANTPLYFTALNEWLDVRTSDNKNKWAQSVWRWLQERDVDIAELHKPAPNTAGKAAMTVANKNALSTAIEAVVDNWEGDFIAVYKIKEVLNRCVARLNPDEIPHYDAQIKNTIKALTYSVSRASVVKIENKTVQAKIKIAAVKDSTEAYRWMSGALHKTEKELVRATVMGQDIDKLVECVNEALDILES